MGCVNTLDRYGWGSALNINNDDDYDDDNNDGNDDDANLKDLIGVTFAVTDASEGLGASVTNVSKKLRPPR